MTALVFVLGPVAQAVPVTISGLTNDPPAVRAGISAALSAALTAEGTPLGMTLRTSVLDEAVQSVPGVVSYDLAAPAAALVVPVGSLPVLGAVTYT